MTDDDLIQFAAEKVGGKPYIKDSMRPAVVVKWMDGFSTLPLHLTDWDLFGRGLAACPYEVTFFRQASIMSTFSYVRLRDFSDRNQQEEFVNNASLPKAFWTAWYKLEHDET